MSIKRIIGSSTLVVLALVHGAQCLRLPNWTSRESRGQVPLSTDDWTSHDLESKLFANQERFDELYWSLTSNDASHALDSVSVQGFDDMPRRIVLSHHANISESAAREHENYGHGHTSSLEVLMSTIGGFPVYHTAVALGQPAQPFTAWLNTRLNGLYVRSSACSKRDCGRGFNYDAKKSSSRKSRGERFEVHPQGWTVGGNVSTDTLHLVSVDVDNALMGEIDKYEGEDLFYFVMEFVVDGALGLAPPKAETAAYHPLPAPNPLHQLVKSHAIERNALTLTLPRNVGERGFLEIGKPSKPGKDAIRVPFANQTKPGLAHTWHVEIDSVSLAGGKKLELPLKSVYGRLDFEPSIGLPPDVATQIYSTLGAKPNSRLRGASIDCKARESLPDLVLGIGGQKIVLSRDEYSFEGAVYGHPFCVVAIEPTESEGVAMLGTTLMEKFHVLIDIDENQLGLHARQ